jgi:hypothetical protein
LSVGIVIGYVLPFSVGIKTKTYRMASPDFIDGNDLSDCFGVFGFVDDPVFTSGIRLRTSEEGGE